MKSIISIFLLMNYSYAFFQIDHTNLIKANRVSAILVKKYDIPQNMISYRKVGSCKIEPVANAIIHFCINKKGELIVLSQNKIMIENSLKIFRKKGAH